jgi:hypothetical protein
VNGTLAIDGKCKMQLQRAERSLQAQVGTEPAYDPPWSFFDLAEIKLYSGKPDEFRTLVEKGVAGATAKWQVKTFHDSLQQLADARIELPGLSEGVSFLKQRLDDFG